VTAPGYEPIVITNSGDISTDVEGGVFVPDIPIMQVDTINIVYENKTVDKENIIQHVNKFEETKIVNVGDNEITIIEGTDNTSMMIIIIGSSSVVLLLLGLLARFFWNKMRE